MASAKDTFEANTFEANTFASGTWRGVGPLAVVPDVPGVEFKVPANSVHYKVEDNRPHFKVVENV